ncbi:MAG: hypothetical protein EBU93_00440 [Chlamydiae bacterium]|nr:hypothetical protein [Chlamydiota bacterium]
MPSGPSPIDGSSSGHYPIQEPNKNVTPFQETHASSSQSFSDFKTFFGEEGYKKFQSILGTMINNRMNIERRKMKEATEKLKNALSGRDE